MDGSERSVSSFSLRDRLIYPTDCLPVDGSLSTVELISRLKVLILSLKHMKDNADTDKIYQPLAKFLGHEILSTHKTRAVKLMQTCCVANLLRILPTLPFTFKKTLMILRLFVQQLQVSNSSSPLVNEYECYLLRTVASSQLLNLCFQCEPAHIDAFCIFVIEEMFQLVKVDIYKECRHFILNILSSLIENMNYINILFPTTFLDIIFRNVVKTSSETFSEVSQELAKDLILKCSKHLESHIKALLIQRLNSGPVASSDCFIYKYVFNTIHWLWGVVPEMLLGVISTLDICLVSKTSDKEHAITILFEMFSDKNSTLAKDYAKLWRMFLKSLSVRDYDIRKQAVDYTYKFLVNQPTLISQYKVILECLANDSEPSIRSKLAKSICLAVKDTPSIVSHGSDVLNIVRYMVKDSKFQVRKDAMEGLGMVYRQFVYERKLTEIQSNIMWIQDVLMENYTQKFVSNVDKNEIKRIFCVFIVPYKLPVEKRMKCMITFWANAKETSRKAFHMMGESDYQVRKLTKELLESTRQWHEKGTEPPVNENGPDWNLICEIGQFMNYPSGACVPLQKLSLGLYKHPNLLNDMERLLDDEISCKESITLSITILARKEVKPHLPIIKNLLRRLVNFLFDKDAINVLIDVVNDCVAGKPIAKDVKLRQTEAGDLGLQFLHEVILMQPNLAFQQYVLKSLVDISTAYHSKYTLQTLHIFKAMARYKPLGEDFAQFTECDLIPKWHHCILHGTPKEIKLAIYCLVYHAPQGVSDMLNELLRDLLESKVSSKKDLITYVLAVGHISSLFPSGRDIEVLLQAVLSNKMNSGLCSTPNKVGQRLTIWCKKDELPDQTLLQIEEMKSFIRCVCSPLREKLDSPIPLLMDVCMKYRGSSDIEDSWLRLSAGLCLLKLCCDKAHWDMFTESQFIHLSYLMTDEVKAVSTIFIEKLCHYLVNDKNDCCLPTDFFAYFMLAKDNSNLIEGNLKVSDALKMTATHRRNQIVRKYNFQQETTSFDQFLMKHQTLVPEWSAAVAMSLVAQHDFFGSLDAEEDLLTVYSCIKFFLDILLGVKLNNIKINQIFLENLFKTIKNCTNFTHPDDTNINMKIWAACDLALFYIALRPTTKGSKLNINRLTLPHKYFKGPHKGFVNLKEYVPLTFLKRLQEESEKKYKSSESESDDNEERIYEKSIEEFESESDSSLEKVTSTRKQPISKVSPKVKVLNRKKPTKRKAPQSTRQAAKTDRNKTKIQRRKPIF